jgi:hypothetical protein
MQSWHRNTGKHNAEAIFTRHFEKLFHLFLSAATYNHPSFVANFTVIMTGTDIHLMTTAAVTTTTSAVITYSRIYQAKIKAMYRKNCHQLHCQDHRAFVAWPLALDPRRASLCGDDRWCTVLRPCWRSRAESLPLASLARLFVDSIFSSVSITSFIEGLLLGSPARQFSVSCAA